jgi:hypothetical protein
MKWTDEEIAYLKDNYSSASIEDLIKHLGKTRSSILHKGTRLGIGRSRHLFRSYPRRTPKKIIYQRYWKKNKERIYKKKMDRRKYLKRIGLKLLGGKCIVCGYEKCEAALEFHHNRGQKEETITNLLKNSSKEKLLKELNKCILLCANCHREVHHQGLVAK